jgi:hypothetical protein
LAGRTEGVEHILKHAYHEVKELGEELLDEDEK